jgi:sortase A
MKRLANVFAFVGLLGLGYCGVYLAKAWLYQADEMRRFARERLNEQRPTDKPSPFKPTPTVKRPYPSSGSAVAVLSIPRVGLSTVVLEGAGERELKLGPGHIPGTSLPGGGGNVGVAGHRDTFFRPLRLIRKDDTIQVTTHEREYHYKVVSTEIVGPDDVQVLYSTQHEMLTLVTCYPFKFVGRAPKRFIVRADCLDCLTPAPTDRISHKVP